MITSEKSKSNQTNIKNSLFLIAFFALIVDQATKLAALHYLRSQPTVPVIPRVFHLTLVENPGVAFGIFYRHADILFIVISICVLCLIIFARSYRKADWVQQAAYGLILGGAIGNWLDRLRIGHVVDFLDFRIWPVFNVADFCISTGVGLFLLVAIINFKKTS